MIRRYELDGVEMYIEDTKVNELEAEQVLRADIEAAKKYFSAEGRNWPREPWYKEESVPVYHDVVYILTDRGWLSDKQRADIIRQGNASPDYEIIEPIQTRTKKEISHYITERTIAGHSEVSLNRSVQLYWLFTGQALTGPKVLKESKYKSVEDKPFDYMTDSELADMLEKASSDQMAVISNEIGESKVDNILAEIDSQYELY